MSKWWGSSWVANGWACLMYDWVYAPLCTRVFGIEPWSVTAYALTLIGIGIAINIFQWAAGERPTVARS